MLIKSDPDSRIGFSNDPAEVDGWSLWIRIPLINVWVYVCGNSSR